MPFLAQQHLPIPNKDIISWMFDELPYDPNKRVRRPLESEGNITDRDCRFSSMLRILTAA